jgi:hypothetical protein
MRLRSAFEQVEIFLTWRIKQNAPFLFADDGEKKGAMKTNDLRY